MMRAAQVMVGGAVAHPAATPEPDVNLSVHPALQYPFVQKKNQHIACRICSAVCIRIPRKPIKQDTCLPSPCGWLSQPPWVGVTPPTTMEAPSPYASRHLGDPVVQSQMT